jgi:hypothetical protein
MDIMADPKPFIWRFFMKLLLTVLALAAFTFAQAQAPAAGSEKKAGKAKTMEMKGMVASVDTAAGKLVLKAEKGEDTLIVNKDTKVKSTCKKTCTLADIKTDKSVTVKCEEKDGKMVALVITEQAEKKAPAKKKAEATPAPAPAPAPAGK